MILKDEFKKIYYLESFFDRFRGLMLKKNISSDSCYILKTNGIHTFFMKFDLDVIYLDKEKKVIHIIKGMKPNRIAPLENNCKYVLEFKNERIINKIKKGEVIKI